MKRVFQAGICLAGVISLALPGFAQEQSPANAPAALDQQTVTKLLDRLAADEQRIKELEQKLQNPSANQGVTPETQNATSTAAPASGGSTPAPATPPVPSDAPVETPNIGDTVGMGDPGMHDHMGLGTGSLLQLHGYFDFNFGVGSDSNPLIFPLGVPTRSTFQAGELALMTSSKLSDKLNFMSEIVIGSDPTNEFGVDVERYMLTYHQNKYFEASAGRFHTAIGYYSTAFHHGTWFQTATGRPFMYFFEDSGGLLPVHTVGATATGLVPGTDRLGLHWIAEVGNGRPSDKFAEGAVQNFYSDRTHKALNLGAYIAPDWLRGLQSGGSVYKDRLLPNGAAPADQTISSFYGVFITPTWEIMNEGVLLSNHIEGGRTFNTPLAYTQLSRKMGVMRPYFRYQYVNSPADDPINVYTGRYMGPSFGIRWDAAEFAAFKLQYNLLEQRDKPVSNGLDAQIALTF
jgi:hypothetical protein